MVSVYTDTFSVSEDSGEGSDDEKPKELGYHRNPVNCRTLESHYKNLLSVSSQIVLNIADSSKGGKLNDEHISQLS